MSARWMSEIMVKNPLCKCSVSSTTTNSFPYSDSVISSVLPLWVPLSFLNCFCLTFDSFLPDVVVACSHSSPCHDHGDSRWPSAAWLNHSSRRHHSLPPPHSVLSWWRGVRVTVLNRHCLAYSFSMGLQCVKAF